MEHSTVEDDDDEEDFPTFGDSESDYDTVSKKHIFVSKLVPLLDL